MKISKQVGVHSLYSLECHQYVDIPLVVDQTSTYCINVTLIALIPNDTLISVIPIICVFVLITSFLT